MSAFTIVIKYSIGNSNHCNNSRKEIKVIYIWKWEVKISLFTDNLNIFTGNVWKNSQNTELKGKSWRIAGYKINKQKWCLNVIEIQENFNQGIKYYMIEVWKDFSGSFFFSWTNFHARWTLESFTLELSVKHESLCAPIPQPHLEKNIYKLILIMWSKWHFLHFLVSNLSVFSSINQLSNLVDSQIPKSKQNVLIHCIAPISIYSKRI